MPIEESSWEDVDVLQDIFPHLHLEDQVCFDGEEMLQMYLQKILAEMERWRMALLMVTEQEETKECQSGWNNMKYKNRENKK